MGMSMTENNPAIQEAQNSRDKLLFSPLYPFVYKGFKSCNY